MVSEFAALLGKSLHVVLSMAHALTLQLIDVWLLKIPVFALPFAPSVFNLLLVDLPVMGGHLLLPFFPVLGSHLFLPLSPHLLGAHLLLLTGPVLSRVLFPGGPIFGRDRLLPLGPVLFTHGLLHLSPLFLGLGDLLGPVRLLARKPVLNWTELLLEGVDDLVASVLETVSHMVHHLHYSLSGLQKSIIVNRAHCYQIEIHPTGFWGFGVLVW